MNFVSKNIYRQIYNQQKRSFSNSVYLWSQMPRLGPKNSEIKQTMQMAKGRPERIEFFDNLDVQKLRIGMRHTAAISADGDLYMFGSGNWGVLGQGTEDDVGFKEPAVVSKFQKLGLKVVDVALGEYHSMALTDDGSVWTWGYAGKKGLFNWMYTQEIGALGHGDKELQFVPKKVKFEDENVKIKSISAGLYHCNALTESGDLYTWGRGLYGVLGNGSNQHALEPELNDVIQAMQEEDQDAYNITKMTSADEFSVIQVADGSLYAWGKNDRGQMGTGVGIGIDMVECENIPTIVDLKDENEVGQIAKNFATGQNTMMIQDTNDDIYITGLKLHYLPKKLNFDPEVLDVKNVRQLACGRKHFIVLTNDNNLLVWGDVLKDKSEFNSEGFHLHFGDKLFDDGQVQDLQVKYAIFGALVKH